MRWLCLNLSLGLATVAFAQEKKTEVVADLAPIVVEGNFELTLRPSVSELAAKAIEKSIDAKQTHDDAIARSPFWNAHFWSVLPAIIEKTDPKDFTTPDYSSAIFRASELELRVSEKQSLIER